MSVFTVSVDMIDIQHADIAVAATDAFSAKRRYDFFFAIPKTSLVRLPSIFVPIILLAFGGAKLTLTGLTAIVTCASNRPSRFVVTRHGAKLGVESMLGNIKFAVAVFALLGRAIFGAIGGNPRFAFVPGVDGSFAPTLHRAIDARAFAVKFFAALWASVHDFSHAYIIPKFMVFYYFAIASKRIAEAQAQLQLELV